MPINPHIFKAYDIRGKYPADIDEDGAMRIANAITSYLSSKQKKKKLKLLVCRDIRTSSPALYTSVIHGITDAGSDVIDAGIATTPFFYFLLHTISCDGGIVITASHNPAEYNGMKIRGKGASPVCEGSGMEEISERVLRGEYFRASWQGKVSVLEDRRQQYVSLLTKNSGVRSMKTVIDACGGATTYVLPHVLENLPHLIYKPIFFEPDGTFKKHSANPLDVRSQRFLSGELKKGGYRFGGIFDGDGDRILFFDEKGSPISSEYIAALFMEEYLKKEKRPVLVLPPNTSRGVREYIEEKGGTIKLSRVGYVFIQPIMQKIKAPLGVELSGHFHFRDFFFKDSGIFALIQLAKTLSHTAQPLSQLVAPMRRYVSSGEVNFEIKNKETILETIAAYYREFRDATISKIDGVSVDFPDWWCNVRGSNSEPLVRLVLEAKTQELFEKKYREVKKFLK